MLQQWLLAVQVLFLSLLVAWNPYSGSACVYLEILELFIALKVAELQHVSTLCGRISDMIWGV